MAERKRAAALRRQVGFVRWKRASGQPPVTGARPSLRHSDLDKVVLIADLAGTAVFALEAALIAIAARLDLLGIFVIAFVASLGGGMLRDVLLGDTPPSTLRHQGYPLAVLAATLVAIGLGHHIQGAAASVVLVLDAAGLALFAAAGTQKALDAGCRPFACIMLGTITATGGGVARDVLLAGVPAVLRVDFYATAALCGAAIIVMARGLGFPPPAGVVAGGLACFVLRILGAVLHWQLPVFG